MIGQWADLIVKNIAFLLNIIQLYKDIDLCLYALLSTFLAVCFTVSIVEMLFLLCFDPVDFHSEAYCNIMWDFNGALLRIVTAV